MGFWAKVKDFIFGAPKLMTDVFDKDSGLLVKAGGFIDGLSYTDQEKAKAFADLAKAVSDHIASTLPESTERSVTRRSIAVLWIKVQLWLILMVAIVIPFNVKLAEWYFKLATCEVMLWGTASIIIFFFGAYAWGAHIKKNGDTPK